MQVDRELRKLLAMHAVVFLNVFFLFPLCINAQGKGNLSGWTRAGNQVTAFCTFRKKLHSHIEKKMILAPNMEKHKDVNA